MIKKGWGDTYLMLRKPASAEFTSGRHLSRTHWCYYETRYVDKKKEEKRAEEEKRGRKEEEGRNRQVFIHFCKDVKDVNFCISWPPPSSFPPAKQTGPPNSHQHNSNLLVFTCKAAHVLQIMLSWRKLLPNVCCCDNPVSWGPIPQHRWVLRRVVRKKK